MRLDLLYWGSGSRETLETVTIVLVRRLILILRDRGALWLLIVETSETTSIPLLNLMSLGFWDLKEFLPLWFASETCAHDACADTKQVIGWIVELVLRQIDLHPVPAIQKIVTGVTSHIDMFTSQHMSHFVILISLLQELPIL